MATPGQRSFVNKLNKRGAAEVRKHVSSTHFGELSKSASGASISAPPVVHHNIPLCDVVEPPDYEDLVAHYQGIIDRDPLQPILEFPFDDIQVDVVRRKVRTIAPVIPERGYETDRHVKDCVRYYTKDYQTIMRRYTNCSCQHVSKEERLKRLHDIPRQEYEMHSCVDQTQSKTTSAVNAGESPPTNSASNMSDLKNSQADPLVPALLESSQNDNIDANNRCDRLRNRHDALFCLYPMQPDDDQIEYAQPIAVPSEQRRHRLLVKCIQLKMEIEIEPIFASMALYNVKERKKVSENFYFDMTSEQVKKMLDGHVPCHDASTLSRSCVFEMTTPSPDLFLVIKLEKVLQQGDISEVVEPYMKDDKNRDRARSNAAFCCEKLGRYRMPFAWTAVYLMSVINQANTLDTEKDQQSQTDSLERQRSGSAAGFSPNENLRKSSLDRPKSGTPDKRDSWNVEELGNALDSFRPVTLTISSFFKQEADKLSDDDLYKNLIELKKTAVSKKLKCLPDASLEVHDPIPGMLKLDVSPCPAELKNSITSELYKIDPYPDENYRPVKEIVEFPIKEVYEPFTTYRNLLFVLPKSLNFANRQGSARNLAVKVCFMAGEEETHALPVLFGKSSCPEYCKQVYTTVTYHNRTPSFYDEIKIRLPAKLNDNHHLLFTFYHISCQRKGAEQSITQLETVVGYTWLPMLRDGRLLTGEFSLPVSVEKPPSHYSMLHPEVQLPNMKWVDNHKGLFTVVIEAVSSIHTLDEHLDRFLNFVYNAEENKIPARVGEANFEGELRRSVSDLSDAHACPLIRFLPLILDKLLQLIVRPPVVAGQVVNIGQAAFEAISLIVKRLQNMVELKFDRHGHNTLLTTYLRYSCTLPQPEPAQTSPGSTVPVSSGYSTLGRPMSLPVNKQQRQLSSSDPDLTTSNPASPDSEVAGLMGSGSRTIDRGLRHELQSSLFTKLFCKKPVHEVLVVQWVMSSGSTRELSFANAWFFLDLIVKSIYEYLLKTDKIQLPRKKRFEQQFMDDIMSLFCMITRDIVDRYIQDSITVRNLNISLAFFVNNCFSIFDRGFVFQLMKVYCKTIVGQIESSCANITPQEVSTLLSLKLDFMRIVCSHEHYVALNLPINLPATTPPSGPPSPTASVGSSTSQNSLSTVSLSDRGLSPELSVEFRMQHFLAGIVLSDLATMLQHQQLHAKAINVVCNLLASHDLDPRYRSPDAKSRIAAIYLPLINITMDSLPQLFDPCTESRSAQQHAPNSTTGQEDAARGIDQTVAMAIAGSSVYGVPGESSSMAKKCALGPEATQDLLVCFLWVLKNIDQRILRSWWADMPASRLSQLLDVLYLCESNFEYKGKLTVRTANSSQVIKKNADLLKARMEEHMLGSASARSEMIRRRLNDSLGSSPANLVDSTSGRVRWRKDQTQWRSAAADLAEKRLREEADCFVEGFVSAEVSLITLDTIELIVQIIRNSDSLLSLLSYVLRTLLHCLALNQSSFVLKCMFASQRSLIAKFPELIFEEDTEQCADLCLRLLRHCSSALSEVRSHASASLYMLMRQNFEIGNTFARVKMQVTMSLSSLVGQSQTFNEDYLRRSLKTILVYAEVDSEFHSTTFPDQVRDLVFNLHMILSDTIKMKEYQEDPEMLIDLMYRIAKGYQNSPDLRLTWLQSMAAKHSERNNNAEAAMCLVHSASLVAEYLNMLEDRVYLPVGCVSFQHISRNVLEESAVSEDVVSPDEEGICTGKFFSELGLVGLVEQAASSFNVAGMFEAVNLVYKILIPIYENNRDFKKLALIHGKLQDAFISISKQEGKRMFGTYFRVGFYGSRFGDLDGNEFVYKEPAITKLPEISHRLESFYLDKFGPGVVDIVKDSNIVEREKLDSSKAYIQITYVEPYFDLYEMRDRITFFDKNYGLKRFMYETPYTKDGRAHGELKEQYKRKTILTTSQAFPYIKTRIAIVGREQIQLTPIEVAIEDIQKKTRELAVALRQDPPHPKMLQMVLQGCIGTTVNQGPVEMALVFLSPLNDGELTTKHHNKLRICFKDFLKKCGDTLQRNKSLIGIDQKDYQRELERNYHQIKDQLSPLISSSVHADARRKHKRRTQKTL